MEPIIIALVASLATGVAVSKPHTLDPAEYERVIRVVTDTTHALGHCRTKDVDISKLEADTINLIEYQSHLANTEHSLKASKEVYKLLLEFKYKHEYSVRYCQHKLSEIQSVSRTLARAMGGMNEYNICSSDVEERYKLYETSYKAKQISKAEYEELVEDVLSLANADKAGCSVENRVKMEQALKIISAAGSASSGF